MSSASSVNRAFPPGTPAEPPQHGAHAGTRHHPGTRRPNPVGRPKLDADTPPDPPDGPGEFDVGPPAHPSGTGPARLPRLRTHGRQVHASDVASAIAHVACLSDGSCPRHRRHRLLRGPHPHLPPPLRLRRPPPRSPRTPPPHRHRSPLGRLDGAPVGRGLSGGHGTAVPPPRSRRDLRSGLLASRRTDGHPRGPHHPARPLAEPLCRAGHRLRSPRVPGPFPHSERAPSPSSPTTTLRAHTNRSTTTVPSPESSTPRHVAESSPFLRSAGFIAATSVPPDHRDRDPPVARSSGPAGCPQQCGDPSSSRSPSHLRSEDAASGLDG
jgi:hypothetical protein